MIYQYCLHLLRHGLRRGSDRGVFLALLALSILQLRAMRDR